jgi:hypothetical protein
MSNTGFLLTDAGLADAAASSPTGPYLHINNFRIGSAYGYAPNRGMKQMVGQTLHTGTPTSYTVIDKDTIDVLLVMDPSVGNFYFGEISIWSTSGVMIGICVFSTLQEKVRALGTTAGNQWKIHARIKLQQAPAICMVTIINTMSIMEVPTWDSLGAPVNQLNGINAVIVHEQNVSSDSVLCIREADFEWATLGYGRIMDGNFSDAGAISDWTTVTHPKISTVYFAMPQTLSRYLIRFADGSIRKIVEQHSTTQLSFTPGVGQLQHGAFSIWEDVTTMNSGIVVASAYEYNYLVNNLNRFWAAPTGTYPASNAGINETALATMNSQPSTWNWSVLGDALRRMMILLEVNGVSGGIAYWEIIDSNFVSFPNNPMSPGIATLTDLYDRYKRAILGLEALRNSYNPGWQEYYNIPSASRTRTLPFTDYVDCNVNVFHPATNDRVAFPNSGGAYIIESRSDTTNPFYQAWNTFFGQIGQVYVERGSTASTTGFGTGSGYGSANMPGSGVLIYNAQTWAPALASTLYYRIYAVANGNAFSYTVQLQIVGLVTYSYTTPGTMSHVLYVRKASSQYIIAPVVPIPVASTGGTF